MIVGVGYLGPDDFNHPRARFNQAPGQEAALAKRIATVLIAHLLRLLSEIERITRPPGHDQVQRALVILVEIVVLRRLLNFRH